MSVHSGLRNLVLPVVEFDAGWPPTTLVQRQNPAPRRPRCPSSIWTVSSLPCSSGLWTCADSASSTSHVGLLFLDYLVERKQLQTQPLSVLSDSRLGIDASYYLSSLIDQPPSREPLLAATGGLPLALTTRIESDLRALEKLHIKPVFVFPGLLPSRRPKQQQQAQFEQNEACKDRREAWAKYESGQEDAATKLFEGRSNIHQWDLWKIVLRIFKHRNVEFLVAPYVAWAQVCVVK